MSVEEDYKDVNTMVYAAKYGNWDDVYSILTRKPYLVNMIPEERTWAALHQAVWWDNEKAVNWLLYECKSCDPLVLTKQNPDHGAGLTPIDVASDPSRPRPAIKQFLQGFTEEMRRERFGTDAPYFISAKDGKRMDKEGLPLLLLALANYKKSFHPSKVNPHEPFNDIMKEIAIYEHNGNHWKHARDMVAAAMKGFAMKESIDIQTNGSSEDAFHESIIRLYTKEAGRLYAHVNLALRRESTSKKLKDYKPEGDELAIAPYTLMLDVVLFYWKPLQQFSGYSYRGLGMTRSDTVSKYTVNLSFVWLQFVSSSKSESVAKQFGKDSAKGRHYTLFAIDNSTDCFWRPRDIIKYSAIPSEQEVLYPAGAEFEVQKIDNEKNDGYYRYTTVYMKLVNPLA